MNLVVLLLSTVRKDDNYPSAFIEKGKPWCQNSKTDSSDKASTYENYADHIHLALPLGTK